MTFTWVSQVGKYKVEKHEVKRPGGAAYLTAPNNGKGCMHTTEGSSVDGALSIFDHEHWAPTFVVGQGRVVQCRPLGAQASTLVGIDNGFVEVQIESVGFSQEGLWLYDDNSGSTGRKNSCNTLGPIVALLGYLRDKQGIPLSRLSGWKDNLSDCSKPLATNNSRRKSRLFVTGPKGWYMHLEAPNESPTWHWDCGALNWSKLFALVAAVPDGGGDVGNWSDAVDKAVKRGVSVDSLAGDLVFQDGFRRGTDSTLTLPDSLKDDKDAVRGFNAGRKLASLS